MKKVLYSAIFGLTAFHALNAHAANTDGLGVAVNYGLISGPALELTYPINDLFQVRGALSAGMDFVARQIVCDCATLSSRHLNQV